MSVIELVSDFTKDVFPSIRAYCQQGMTDFDAVEEANRAAAYAGLWDAERGCIAEKVFTQRIARRMGLDGSTVVWDRALAVREWVRAIQQYRDHLRSQQAANYGTQRATSGSFYAELPRDGRRIVANR